MSSNFPNLQLQISYNVHIFVVILILRVYTVWLRKKIIAVFLVTELMVRAKPSEYIMQLKVTKVWIFCCFLCYNRGSFSCQSWYVFLFLPPGSKLNYKKATYPSIFGKGCVIQTTHSICWISYVCLLAHEICTLYRRLSPLAEVK